MPDVLIFGDDTRSFLTTVRSLGRKGITVHVAPTDWSSPALQSRFVTASHRVTPYSLDADAWVKDVKQLLAPVDFDLIIPCNEQAIFPLVEHRDALGNPPIAVVNNEAFDHLFDKHLTRQIAEKAGVPTAPGKLLTADDTAQSLAKDFGLPLAIKPRMSFRLDKITRRGAVVLARSEGDVAKALKAVSDPEDFLIEGFFDGVGVGVSVLAKDGDLLQAFQHRRKREPRQGGGSSYRVAEQVNDSLLKATRKIAKEVKLTGLAMFEYRQNPKTGDFILLEVNARLWGSVPLPVAAGLDFPYLMYQLMTDQPLSSQMAYKVPTYSRNIRNDLEDLVNGLISGGIKAIPGTIAGFLGYWRWALGEEASDTNAADDPDVHKADMAAFKENLCRRIRQKISFLGGRDANEARKQFSDILKQRRPRSICLLCHGNICRSPFAEKLLAKLLEDQQCDVPVFSAGTLAVSARPTPENGQRAATMFDIDLSSHLSSYVGTHQPDDFDIVFYFDEKNVMEWRQIGWSPDATVFNLAHFIGTPGSRQRIADPIGKSVEGFKACYDDIAKALNLVAIETGKQNGA